MTNWVMTTIKIESGSEASLKDFNLIQKRIKHLNETGSNSQPYEAYSVPFLSLFPHLQAQVDNGADVAKLLGAKYCNVGCYGSFIFLESSSEEPDYPHLAVTVLASEIMKNDPSSIVSTVYLEESPKFAGFEIFYCGDVYDNEYFTVEYLADHYGICFALDDEDEDSNTMDKLNDLLDSRIKDTVYEILSDHKNQSVIH